MPKEKTIQDCFLENAWISKTPVRIITTNGFQFTATIIGFDNFSVAVKASSVQLVYKHAISTIIPTGAVNICGLGGADESNQAVNQK